MGKYDGNYRIFKLTSFEQILGNSINSDSNMI